MSRPRSLTLAAVLGAAALALGACTIGDSESDAPVLTTQAQNSTAQSSTAATSISETAGESPTSTTAKAADDPNVKYANGDGTYRLTDDAPDPNRPPEDVAATFSNLEDEDLEGMRCSFKHEIFDEAGVSISTPDPSEGFENDSCRTYVVELPKDALGHQSVQVTIARPGYKPFVVRQDIINVG